MILKDSPEAPLSLSDLEGLDPVEIEVKQVEVERDKAQFEKDWKQLQLWQMNFREEGLRHSTVEEIGIDPPEYSDEEKEQKKKDQNNNIAESFLNNVGVWIPISFLLGFGLVMMLLTPLQVFELINIRLSETYGKRTMTVYEISQEMGTFFFGAEEGAGEAALVTEAPAEEEVGFLFEEEASAGGSEASTLTTWLPYIIALGSVIFIIQIKMGLGAIMKRWPGSQLWINIGAALLAVILLGFWTQTILRFEEKGSEGEALGVSSVLQAQQEADALISQAVTWVLPVEVLLTALLLSSGLRLFTRWRAALEKGEHWEYADQLERRIRATYDHITKLEQDLKLLGAASSKA